METTYLVQRLNDPPKSDMESKINQAFGNAALGLSPDGWKACQQAFSFDYMGAAEYEFGTIPRCLTKLFEDRAQLTTAQVLLRGADIEPNWERNRTPRTKSGRRSTKKPKYPPVADCTVYVLCRRDHVDGAEVSIRGLAKNLIRVKCGGGMASALDPVIEPSRTKGWLELDNGFLFFVDKTMWRKTTILFTGQDPDPTAI